MYSQSDLYFLLMFHPLFPAVACSSWNNGDRVRTGMAQMSHQTSDHQPDHYFHSGQQKLSELKINTLALLRTFQNNSSPAFRMVAGDFLFEVLRVNLRLPLMCKAEKLPPVFGRCNFTMVSITSIIASYGDTGVN